MRSAPIVAALWALVLIGMRAAAQAPAPSPAAPMSPRAAQVRAEVRGILSSPEYGLGEPRKSLVERIGDVLLGPVRRFFSWLGGLFKGVHVPAPSGPAGEILVIVLYVVLVSAAVFLVARLIVALVRRSAQRASETGKKPTVSSSAIEDLDPSVEPDAWIDLARQHAAQGDLRSAYRAAFTAVLVRLDRLGAIRYERQRTNGEYLRALRAHPVYLAAVRPATREFDARWYGRLAVAESDYERMLATYARLVGEPAS